jgi:hypothetical protein
VAARRRGSDELEAIVGASADGNARVDGRHPGRNRRCAPVHVGATAATDFVIESTVAVMGRAGTLSLDLVDSTGEARRRQHLRDTLAPGVL